MIYSVKEDCCGCEACANICPKGAITMQPDEEGFFYPSIDNSACIGCDMCEKVCPVKSADEICSCFTKAFSGTAKADEDIIRSSSGGFATVLGRSFIKAGGVVYGVSYSEDYRNVIYKRAKNPDETEQFRGSKYSQVEKQSVYRNIMADLNKGRKVLFIGTPCDVYALIRYVKDDQNLYTAALVCHGPTSPMLHEAFCIQLEERYSSSLSGFSLRYKRNGNWKPYYIRALFKNGAEYLEQFNKTDYETTFQYFKRPSCGKCRFKGNGFRCDILMGDNHAALENSPEYNPHGASSILPLSDKADFLLELVKDEFSILNTDLKKAINQMAIHSPIVRTNNRQEFVRLFNLYGLHGACCEKTIKAAKRRQKLYGLYNKTVERALRYITRFGRSIEK